METVISAKKIKSGNVLERMRFIFCADRENFTKAFKSIGVEVKNEKDLETLAQLHELGDDVKGKLKNNKSQDVVFNLTKFIDQIQIRHSNLNNCQIKLVD